MEMEQMKTMVIQASSTFYSTQDAEQRRSAEEWLNNFKKSVHAWHITDQILHTEKNEQVLFFAAQTIRSKIQQNFHELPLDCHDALRLSLLEHLEKLSTCNLNTVQTQIYIAIADLIMFMNTWHDPIHDLLQKFSNSHLILIELLKTVSEEVNNKRLKLGLNRRDHVKRILYDSSPSVLEFLQTSLNQYHNDVTKVNLIYKCFSSWIEEHLFDETRIFNSELFGHMFQLLSDPSLDSDLHETLTNCLINIITSFYNQINTYNYSLMVKLKENVLKLATPYKQAEESDSREKCIDFCNIFTELCITLSYYLINEPNSALGDFDVIKLILLCASNKDYDIFQKSFIFWFNVSEDIYSHNNSEKCSLNFQKYVEHLLDSICKHCRLPMNHNGVPPTKSTDFGEFRLKATDLISDIIFIVGSNRCFENLYHVLQQPVSSWVDIEAALFIMSSIARNVSSDEDRSVPQVVQALINLNDQVHIAVRYTGVKLIGELADWLNANPQYIDACLNFVFRGFNDTSLCQIAANTMLNICQKCQKHMINHLDTLLNIALSADSVNIPSDASIGLLKGTVVILCNLPMEKITEPLMKISKIQFEGLKKVLSEEIKEGSKASPTYWLDRLTAIFRTIKFDVYQVEQSTTPNPCQPVVELMWPLLSTCLKKYEKDNKVAESSCRTLRFALRCTEKYSRSILEPVVNLVVGLYQSTHFSCYLYMGSILVDIYATETTFRHGLMQMMQAFTNEAFSYIIQNCKTIDNINQLRKHPETIDDFFRLGFRFLQRSPKEFIENPIFIPIINLAVNILNVDHREAHCAVTKFLSEFISLANNATARGVDEVTNKLLISQLIQEVTPKIITNLVNSIVNMATRDTKDGIADLLVELMSSNNKLTDISLLNALRSLEKLNNQGVEIVSDAQLYDIHDKIMRSSSTTDIEYAIADLEKLFQ